MATDAEVFTKAELKREFRTRKIMFKKKHSATASLDILEKYDENVEFFWPVVLRCVPLSLSFLLVSKKIRRIMLQYYMGCMALMYFYIGNCQRSRYREMTPFSTEWVTGDDLVERLSVKPYNFRLKKIPSPYTREMTLFQGTRRDMRFREKIFNVYFSVGSWKLGDLSVDISIYMISMMSLDLAKKYMAYFLMSDNISVFKCFIETFPELLNFDGCDGRPIDLAFDFDLKPFSPKGFERVKFLVENGVDMSKLCCDNSRIYTPELIETMLNLGAFESQDFVETCLKSCFEELMENPHGSSLAKLIAYTRELYVTIEKLLDVGFDHTFVFRSNIFELFWNFDHPVFCLNC